MVELSRQYSFQWDEGNRDKNWHKHGVTARECEEAFLDKNKKLLNKRLYSGEEERYILLGKTAEKRLLFIVFTMRDQEIRVISTRDINQQERYLYE